MTLRYLHTMVRVKDLDASLGFYALLGLEETRRHVSEKGRFTLVFMAAPGQPDCPVELTYNWDGDDGLPGDSRHFGHLAYAVDNIYDTCARLHRAVHRTRGAGLRLRGVHTCQRQDERACCQGDGMAPPLT